MVDKNKVIADLGLITETTLGQDLFNPIHIRYKAVLDHDIDEELFKKAWEKVKRVYPIVDAVLGLESGDVGFYMDPAVREKHSKDHAYLVEPESGRNDPVKSKVPIEPGCELVGGRLICVSFYERTVTISTYHALVDGGGLNTIFTAFLYEYLVLYTGHEDEAPVADLTEGRDIGDYYQGATLDYVFSQEYTPVPLYTLPLGCTGFRDDDMVKDDDGVVSGTLNVPVKEFIKFCKENGANPSSMMCTLLAKAAYALNPEVQDDIVFDLTVSVRNILGIERTVANSVGLAVAYTTRDDITNRTVAEISQKIRRDVDIQRTKDHYISFRRLFYTYKHAPSYKARTVTYIGALNVGDNNRHIVDLDLGTNSLYNLYMMQLNDKFIITLQHGKATEKYMNELVKLFSEHGIKAEVKHSAHYLAQDSKTQVL